MRETRRNATVAFVIKRIVAAYLWICVCLTFGAFVEEAFGLTRTVGLLIGIAVAAAIVLMPDDLWKRRVRWPGGRSPDRVPLALPESPR